jgi:Asp-tRNA(Asn)/Glu-tRNA(Gln) amidotransferase A subunit family amidase
MKTALDAKPWLTEPTLYPFPWRDQVSYLERGSGKTLKVGVIWDDGVVKPHPPVMRALKEVVEKLRATPGVEVVDWKPYKHDYAWERIASLFYADGATHNLEILAEAGEPLLPLSQFIIMENSYRKRLQIEELWGLLAKNEKYKKEYATVWNETATGVDECGLPTGMVDVILAPVGPGAAPPLNQARYWGYTAQWNLLDYPAAVFPVTQVKPDVDVVEADYMPRNDQDEFNYKLCMCLRILVFHFHPLTGSELDDPEVHRDAPISLQLIGRPYEDEKVFPYLVTTSRKTPG